MTMMESTPRRLWRTGFAQLQAALSRLFTRAPADRRRSTAFTAAVIGLAAKMAKADGVVTRDEEAAFRKVFPVAAEDQAAVHRLFALAQQHMAGYEAYAARAAKLFHDDPATLADLLDALFAIATADGAVHEAELRYLRRVAELFGIGEEEFGCILARHVRLPDDPYAVLGLDRSASNDEIKARRRDLALANHPDRLIARGIPPEFVTLATKRLARINAAYDRIARERGL